MTYFDIKVDSNLLPGGFSCEVCGKEVLVSISDQERVYCDHSELRRELNQVSERKDD